MLAEPTSLGDLQATSCLAPSWEWEKEAEFVACTCCKRGYTVDFLIVFAGNLRIALSANTYHPKVTA